MLNFLRKINLSTLYGKWLSKTPERHSWRAYRYHGGELHSPRAMTEEEACDWVSNLLKGDITFIDRECGFIFYRPRE